MKYTFIIRINIRINFVYDKREPNFDEKMTMIASKIFYNNEPRIKVDFKFNYESVAAIRTIPDCKWSKIHNAWHVPYDKPTFELLKEKFSELDYEGKSHIADSETDLQSIQKNHLYCTTLIRLPCRPYSS